LRLRTCTTALAGLSLALIGACGSPPPTSNPTFVAPAPTAVTTTAEASATPQAGSVPAAGAQPTPTKAQVKASPKRAEYTFPVVGESSYARSHHDYPATDIMTACGHKFVAVTDGTVLNVTTKDVWKASVNAGATRGGLSVSIRGDDGARYYGSHLSAIASGIKVGVRVKMGQLLARTGDTGDASACHLHFGISPPCAGQGDWWLQRGTVWPYSFLDSWRKGGSKSAVATVKAWQARHGCSKKAPAGA
jgi:murein DD-endopeptidase MepM/ murein hydrolase activator NlpD